MCVASLTRLPLGASPIRQPRGSRGSSRPTTDAALKCFLPLLPRLRPPPSSPTQLHRSAAKGLAFFTLRKMKRKERWGGQAGKGQAGGGAARCRGRPAP